MEIGVQFYTLRESCKDLAGLDETLKKVADIGYKNVQLSGVCAYEPEWIKEKLEAYGLKCVLTHTAADKLKKVSAKGLVNGFKELLTKVNSELTEEITYLDKNFKCLFIACTFVAACCNVCKSCYDFTASSVKSGGELFNA